MLRVIPLLITVPPSWVGLLPNSFPIYIKCTMPAQDLHSTMVDGPFTIPEVYYPSFPHLLYGSFVTFHRLTVPLDFRRVLHCSWVGIVPVSTHSVAWETVLYAVDVLINVDLWALFKIFLFLCIVRALAHSGAAYRSISLTTDSFQMLDKSSAIAYMNP